MRRAQITDLSRRGTIRTQGVVHARAAQRLRGAGRKGRVLLLFLPGGLRPPVGLHKLLGRGDVPAEFFEQILGNVPLPQALFETVDDLIQPPGAGERTTRRWSHGRSIQFAIRFGRFVGNFVHRPPAGTSAALRGAARSLDLSRLSLAITSTLPSAVTRPHALPGRLAMAGALALT